MKKFLTPVLCALFASNVLAESGPSYYATGRLAVFSVYRRIPRNRHDADEWEYSGWGELELDGSYGAEGAHIQALANPLEGSGDEYLNEAYVYGEGPFGRMELGLAKNISAKTHMGVPDVGPLYYDGAYALEYTYIPDGMSALATTAIRTDASKAKANYISPEFHGFQLAGSYTPETRRHADGTRDLKDGHTAALLYNSDGGLGLSAAYGRFREIDMPGIGAASTRREISLGAKYYFRGLQGSAAWRRAIEDGAIGSSADGYAVSYGLAYEFGPVEISISNHSSRTAGTAANPARDKLDLSLISARYTAGRGRSASFSLGRAAFEAESGARGAGAVASAGLAAGF